MMNSLPISRLSRLRPHTDELQQQKVTMSSLNSNWVNISHWQQQQSCGYIFTEIRVTPDKKHHHQQQQQEKYGLDRNVSRPSGEMFFYLHESREVSENDDCDSSGSYETRCNKWCSHCAQCQVEVTLIGSWIFTALSVQADYKLWRVHGCILHTDYLVSASHNLVLSLLPNVLHMKDVLRKKTLHHSFIKALHFYDDYTNSVMSYFTLIVPRWTNVPRFKGIKTISFALKLWSLLKLWD